ncbi:MAG: hypothetical protein AB8G99_14940 [Planctomycetaceae bacterium]
MTYLTENPWPLTAMFGIFAMFFAWSAMRSGQKSMKGMAIIALLLAFVPPIVDRMIETDREVLTKHLSDLRDAVVAGDVSAALQFVDGGDNLPGSAREQIESGMAKVDVQDNLRIKGIKIDVKDKQATSDFRANGTVDVKNYADGRHVATRWRLTWDKRGSDWKVTLIERLDPVRGEVMGVFESAP